MGGIFRVESDDDVVRCFCIFWRQMYRFLLHQFNWLNVFCCYFVAILSVCLLNEMQLSKTSSRVYFRVFDKLHFMICSAMLAVGGSVAKI